METFPLNRYMRFELKLPIHLNVASLVSLLLNVYVSLL